MYVETSAVAKLLVPEAESSAVAQYLNVAAAEAARLVSSMLTETETRRLAVREELDQADVTAVLDGFELVELARSTYQAAGVLPGRALRSLDALHVAAALRLDADVFVAYDRRQCDAARAVGLQVRSPA